MARYPELTLRNPEGTSMSRLTGFNKVQVKRFFDLLCTAMESKKYTPNQIFNVDESDHNCSDTG